MKILLLHLVEILKNKKVLYFVVLFAFTKQVNSVEKHKPSVNENTPIRIEYGCKRPQTWKTHYLNINVDEKNIDCHINTRNIVLYYYSQIPPKIEVKQCKKNQLCCKVLSGEWEVYNGEENIIVHDPNELQIDHVLPFAYIRLNMKDCKLTDDYYNYLPNLRPEIANVNLKKSNNLCRTKEECEEQKLICKSMAEEFEDKNLCEEIGRFFNSMDLQENKKEKRHQPTDEIHSQK